MMFGYILRREKKKHFAYTSQKDTLPTQEQLSSIVAKTDFSNGLPGVGRDFDQKYEIFFKRLGKNV